LQRNVCNNFLENTQYVMKKSWNCSCSKNCSYWGSSW